MKNIITGIAVLAIVIGVNVWAEARDEKLMSFCADHVTKTLRECN